MDRRRSANRVGIRNREVDAAPLPSDRPINATRPSPSRSISPLRSSAREYGSSRIPDLPKPRRSVNHAVARRQFRHLVVPCASRGRTRGSDDRRPARRWSKEIGHGNTTARSRRRELDRPAVGIPELQAHAAAQTTRLSTAMPARRDAIPKPTRPQSRTRDAPALSIVSRRRPPACPAVLSHAETAAAPFAHSHRAPRADRPSTWASRPAASDKNAAVRAAREVERGFKILRILESSS